MVTKEKPRTMALNELLDKVIYTSTEEAVTTSVFTPLEAIQINEAYLQSYSTKTQANSTLLQSYLITNKEINLPQLTSAFKDDALTKLVSLETLNEFIISQTQVYMDEILLTDNDFSKLISTDPALKAIIRQTLPGLIAQEPSLIAQDANSPPLKDLKEIAPTKIEMILDNPSQYPKVLEALNEVPAIMLTKSKSILKQALRESGSETLNFQLDYLETLETMHLDLSSKSKHVKRH